MPEREREREREKEREERQSTFDVLVYYFSIIYLVITDNPAYDFTCITQQTLLFDMTV